MTTHPLITLSCQTLAFAYCKHSLSWHSVPTPLADAGPFHLKFLVSAGEVLFRSELLSSSESENGNRIQKWHLKCSYSTSIVPEQSTDPPSKFHKNRPLPHINHPISCFLSSINNSTTKGSLIKISPSQSRQIEDKDDTRDDVNNEEDGYLPDCGVSEANELQLKWTTPTMAHHHPNINHYPILVVTGRCTIQFVCCKTLGGALWSFCSWKEALVSELKNRLCY